MIENGLLWFPRIFGSKHACLSGTSKSCCVPGGQRPSLPVTVCGYLFVGFFPHPTGVFHSHRVVEFIVFFLEIEYQIIWPLILHSASCLL